MRKFAFAMMLGGLTTLMAGTWVTGKIKTIQQWENNSYFWISSTSPQSGTVKLTISSVLNAEGQKKLLSMMLTAQAMDATVSVYTPTNSGDVDYNGNTMHLMKSVKVNP